MGIIMEKKEQNPAEKPVTAEKTNIGDGDTADSAKKAGGRKKITPRRIAAMAGVIFLGLLYIVTLIVALIGHSASGRLLWSCIFATVAVPILIWVYIWLYEKITGRRNLTESPAGSFTEPDDKSAP